jgi:hypothetical protein
MDTHALIGKVITRSHAIEKLLKKHYPAAKGSLHAAIKSAADILPAILIRAIKVVANVRNLAAHPDGFKPTTVPADFDRLCNEIEWLIPYFANQPQAKAAQSAKRCKSTAPNAQMTAATSKG